MRMEPAGERPNRKTNASRLIARALGQRLMRTLLMTNSAQNQPRTSSSGRTTGDGVGADGSPLLSAKATLAWHCVRTQPKHEHIAAAHLRKTLHLEVFNPKLRVRRATRRGAVWFIEALFPGYIFARFDWVAHSQQVRGSQGVSTLVTFGTVAPVIPDGIIQSLRAEFDAREVHEVPDTLRDGDIVTIAGGAFHGLQATVLRVLAPTARVQVLLDILGGTTKVDVPLQNVTREEKLARGPRATSD
jgi:transcriptional antiterminator RfaH